MTDKKFSYDELDVVIRAYKDGDKSVGPRLHEAFKGFIGRYVDIVRGRYDISDRLTREFIALYMQDKDKRRHIHQYTHMPAVRQEIFKVAEHIKYMFRSFEAGEIESEMVIAIYELANRYAFYDELPRFHTYVVKTFSFEAKRRLDKLLADPVAYQYNDRGLDADEIPSAAAFDDIIEKLEMSREYAARIAGSQLIKMEDQFENVINENWINGITCAEPFQTLSKLERRLLKLAYQDELTDQKIADIIGCCRATVNRRRLVAEEKVKDAVRKGYSL